MTNANIDNKKIKDDCSYLSKKIGYRYIVEDNDTIQFVKQSDLGWGQGILYLKNEDTEISLYRAAIEGLMKFSPSYGDNSEDTIEGKVIATQKEQVKLNLNIDGNQDEGTAYWFNYAPPSVNIMYSMPLEGESARLYFPNEETETPIVIGCVRKNGDTCTQTSEPANRYFQTESGNEIAMLPEELSIKAGSRKNKGVHIKSPKKLSLNADGEITLKTQKRVKIKAQSQILLMKRNNSHKVSIEGDFYIKGNNVIMDGSNREAYATLEE